MWRWLFILSFTFLALVFTSCHDEVLTNGNAQPTVVLNASGFYDFGSLLSGSTSSTQRLLLYNRNKGALELQSIVLRGGRESAFRINVDGMSGTSFTRPELLRIAQGDSLFVLMEVKVPSLQQDREMVLEDFIDISCNGQVTSIPLKAVSLNVEQLRDSILTTDLRWDANGHDKQIFGTLIIPAGVTLTIADSIKLFMHDQSRIEVFGRLMIDGTMGHPVTLIGDRTDKMFDNLYYRDMGGQWGGVVFHPGSEGNVLNRALVKGMTEGIRVIQTSAREADLSAEFLADGGQQLIICNSVLMNADSALVYAENSNLIVENSLLMNSGGSLLELHGGVYDVTHCTLANYAFWTSIREADLKLTNFIEKKDAPLEHAPLYRCQLTNTLVFGRSERDPNVDLCYHPFITDEGLAADSIFAYSFDHCFLQDPLYVLIDMPNYICDPHLQPESPARAQGSAKTLKRLPYDLDGLARGETPTIGCYE